MKLVLHIVAKDLRRLRGWVIGWLVVVALPVVIGGLLLREERMPTQWNGYGSVLAGALGLQVVVAYLISILLVQADRVVGTEAFWGTRPISGGRLLTAKLVTAGVIFMGGAVLLYVPWWLYCGLGIPEIFAAVVELLPPTAAVVLPAMLIGALTDSLGRALLWSLILAAGGVMTPMLFTVVLNTASPRTGSDMVLYLVIGIMVTLLAMAGAIALLYWKRWYTRWLAVPAAGLVVALLVGRFLPLAWRPANEPSEWRPEQAAHAKVEFYDAHSLPGVPSRNTSERWDNAWVGFTLQGISPDLIVEGVGARHRWTWEGGAHVGRESRLNVRGTSSGTPLLGFKWLPPDPETVEWWRQQRSPPRVSSQRPTTGPADGVWLQANLPLPGSIAERLDRDPAAYTGSLWLTLRRPTILNELPLRLGSRNIGESHGMRILGIEARDDRAVIRIVETASYSWRATYQEWRHRGRWFGTRNEREYALLNRVRREFLPLSGGGQSFIVAGVQLSWRVMTVRGLQVRRADKWVTRPGWLDDVSVALIRGVPQTVFRRDISVEAMRVRRADR